MGTIYYVACKDCKVTRDLDKFYNHTPVKTRGDALELGKRIADNAFRPALLVSFMSEHFGHDCVFFSEHCCEHLDPTNNKEFGADKDYFLDET